jgi:thioredoxin-related protein
MKPARRLVIFSSLYALFFSRSNAKETLLLPLARALDTELKSALSKNQPLIVMVGFKSCPYCQVVRQNYMPAVINEQKLTVVEIDLLTDLPVQDFEGRATAHRQLAKEWGVKTSPTLLFFGRKGQEVASRLAGVSTDFYGAYLQERIDEASAKVRQ